MTLESKRPSHRVSDEMKVGEEKRRADFWIACEQLVVGVETYVNLMVQRFFPLSFFFSTWFLASLSGSSNHSAVDGG